MMKRRIQVFIGTEASAALDELIEVLGESQTRAIEAALIERQARMPHHVVEEMPGAHGIWRGNDARTISPQLQDVRQPQEAVLASRVVGDDVVEAAPDAEQAVKVALLCPICDLEECSCTLAQKRAALVLPKKEARKRRKAELGESVKGALPVAKDRDSRLSVEHDQQIARPAYRATKSLDVTDRAAGKTEVENRESSEPRTFQSFPKPSRKGAK